MYNHLARPRSWGLFSAAAAQSGSYTFLLGQRSPAEMEATYEAVLTATGCAVVECLQKLSTRRQEAEAEERRQAQAMLGEDGG